MPGAPASDRLPPKQRQLFVEQFEKDVRFLQLLFLLLNRSCPIKNFDLVWKERGPSGRATLRHLGVVEALSSSCSSWLGSPDENPHCPFCQIINDGGRQEARSCALSDSVAAERVGKTGKPEVYRCHFGLEDIAVPVIAGGAHIATLYSGQVLRERPSQESFGQVLRDVAGLEYIDPKALETAYRSVHVVTEEDVRNTTEIMQTFAEFLANSWTRMAGLVKEQDRRNREAQLARKELAYLVLDGTVEDRASLQNMFQRLGLTARLNRVMVVRPEREEDLGRAFDVGWTAAVQAAEDVCERHQNALAVHLRNRGICVFFSDREGRNPKAGDLHSYRLARSIVQAIQERGGLRVRAGIGGPKPDWASLAGSYQEACLALASQDVIAMFRDPAESPEELSALSAGLCRAVLENKLEEARSTMGALASATVQRLASDVGQQRLFLNSSLALMSFTAERLGVDAGALSRLREQGLAALEVAKDSKELQNSYLVFAGRILSEVRRFYLGRRVKRVERAIREIDRRLGEGEPISITGIASLLGISTGHFSRIFRRATDETFERYVMKQRIELAKRLLLEPVARVAEVAERCGFAEPAYFARVFRKMTGLSPREYCEDPARVQHVRAS
jgi:AraC-like DNA-binding protein/ligand-binding sensor protein